MAVNFGFRFRANWLFNWSFVIAVTACAIMHLYVILVPGKFSCIFRVNCRPEDIVLSKMDTFSTVSETLNVPQNLANQSY
jgi:hypothetical protein